LKSDVLKLQAGIQEMNTEVDGLNESLKTSTNRVRELEEQVKELSNALASAQAQLNLPDISELIPSTSTPSQPSSASKTRNRGAQSKKNTGD
jgi:chromosome segregation ATPase